MIVQTKNWETEACFVDAAFDPVADYFSESGNTFICGEVGVGRSIADIAGFVIRRSTLPVLDHPFNITESIVLSHLRNDGATRIDLLEQRCGMEPRSLRGKKLSRLIGERMIQFGDGGQISLDHNYPIPCSIVAVEAKLTRWRDALKQAVDYLAYADLSFVLLPTELSKTATENHDKFQEAGIGLLLFDAVNGIKCATAPTQQNRSFGWRRDFVFSSLISQAQATNWYA